MYSAEMYKIMKTRSSKLIVLITIIASAVVAFLPHYHSFEELITCMGETAHVFALFAAVMIATKENGNDSIKNIVSSGMKPSLIYYARLKAAIAAGIFLYLIDAVVSTTIVTVFYQYPVNMGIGAIIANVIFHLAVVVLGSMLYYAVASFLADPVWSVMACLAYFLFAAQALADVTNRFKLPVDLESFVLGGIKHYNIMEVSIMQGIGVAINIVIVLIVVLMVPVLIGRRNLK